MPCGASHADDAADQRLAVDRDGGLGAHVGQRPQAGAEARGQEQRAGGSTSAVRIRCVEHHVAAR